MGTHEGRRIHLPSKRMLVTAAGVLAAAGTAAGLLVATGATAGAAGGTNYGDLAKGKGYHTCLDPKTLIPTAWNGKPQSVFWPNDAAHPIFCVNGRIPAVFGAQGPAGATGATGQNGQDLTQLTVTAVTTVTNWPEGSRWADDNYTRTLSITRQHAAQSARCGGTPQCWFYTGTLADNGTFTSNESAKAPNGDGKTIAGTVTGTMIGGAHLEFYASSDSPNASNVPAVMDGNATTTTSTWAKQAFPEGTSFSSVSLTQYTWTYTATAPNTCEKWVDQINPGDDGQSEADGNITGVNAC